KLTPEQQKQVDALEMWKAIVGDMGAYDKIINARFGNKEYGDKFTLPRLASIIALDGQIEGAEFLRQHIFSFIDISKQNPELAREMVSDEAIARAIIYTYNLDLKKITSTTGNSLENLIFQLELRKNSLKMIPERNTQQKELARTAIRDMEKQLISTVLPYVSTSEYDVGKLLRFIVYQGLNSAEEGNPHLEINKYFETQKADIQVSPDTIRTQNVGAAEVHDRSITYEQTMPDSTLSRTHGTTLPIDYRIMETYDRDQVTVHIQAAVNERLFESLPDNIAGAVGMNPAIGIFYDKNGDLRTELRGKDRRAIWDRIRRGQILGFTVPDYIDLIDNQYTNIPGGQSASEQALNYISTLSPSAEGMYTVAIANGILQQNPEIRLQEIRGFSVTMPIGVTRSDTGENRQFTLDFRNDGNFYISDITDPTRPQQTELNHYFKKRTEEYMTNLGIQALSSEDQSALQNEFATILMPIGNEVRKAQQRR
ncbi:MAG TPA: hypothetical protein PLD54_00265, partial [Candidatus Levybacteria bacterium]|nr:hypothetical protein [Candidatus Levybacteria bacterium]